MRIGYPCINLTVGCKGDRTFRLKSYSEERLKQTVENNLDCLLEILKFNNMHRICFFRVTSDLVPFASHPINTFDWQGYFGPKLEEIGEYARKHRMRISMHPDQFTLINSVDKGIFQQSRKELAYHSSVLNLMKLETDAKIQVHVGGIYGDKEQISERFARRFFELEDDMRRRLVIENDDRLYNLQDCLKISEKTGIPVLLDVFHHRINGNGETAKEALQLAGKTWREKQDGVPMVDYSSQRIFASAGQHIQSIDIEDFQDFLAETFPLDFDIMLEIKDKEKSAIKAVKAASDDPRFSKIAPNHSARGGVC